MRGFLSAPVLPPGESVHKLYCKIREGVDVLYGKVRKSVHHLPFAAGIGKSGHFLYAQIRKRRYHLYFKICKMFHYLHSAVKGFAVAGTVGNIGSQYRGQQTKKTK